MPPAPRLPPAPSVSAGPAPAHLDVAAPELLVEVPEGDSAGGVDRAFGGRRSRRRELAAGDDRGARFAASLRIRGGGHLLAGLVPVRRRTIEPARGRRLRRCR